MYAQCLAPSTHFRRRFHFLAASLAILGLLTFLLADRRAVLEQVLKTRPFKSEWHQTSSRHNDLDCPAKLAALYGQDRFDSVPWSKDTANVAFPAGFPVEDAALCNPKLSKDKVAVLIEMLDDANLIPHILHFIQQLRDDWPIILYHSKVNEASITSNSILRPFLLSGKVQRVRLNTAFLTHDAVSQFLAHLPFYEHLAPAKHVFLFQTDSTLCSNSTQSIEDFFAFDYIGAPINHEIFDEPIPRFNGGLSLRNREAIMQVIRESAPFEDEQQWIWEDQWLSIEMARSSTNYKLPTVEEASAFAVESVFHPAPLGVHRPQMFIPGYASEEKYQELLDYCPEIDQMKNRSGPTVFNACDNDPDSDECALHKAIVLMELHAALDTCETDPDGETCLTAKTKAKDMDEPVDDAQFAKGLVRKTMASDAQKA